MPPGAGRFAGLWASEKEGVPLRWESAVLPPLIPEGGEMISIGGIGLKVVSGTPTRLVAAAAGCSVLELCT